MKIRPVRRPLRRLAVLAVAVTATLAFASPAWAETFAVTKTSDTRDGLCDQDCSLREAITAANDEGANPGRDSIVFDIPTTDPGYDAGADRSTVTLTDRLPDLSSVTIVGRGAEHLTVRHGDPVLLDKTGRVFTVASGADATIEGLTVSGGKFHEGGGILNPAGSTLEVRDSVISDNSAHSPDTPFGGVGIARGGGIHNSGTLTLTNSTVSGNDTAFIRNPLWEPNGGQGGGIYNSGSLTLMDSTVGNNTAESQASRGIGGGIYNEEGARVTARSSEISANTAQAGGGIYNDGVVRLADSTVGDNTALSNATYHGGGGIFNSGGTIDLTRTLIASNAAPFAGGVRSYVGGGFGGTINATASTFSGNEGGGIHLIDSAGNFTGNTVVGGIFMTNGTNLKLRGSLVDGIVRSGSTIELEGYNFIGGISDTSGNPSDDYSETDNPGTNILGKDPRLGLLRDNGGPTLTHALLPESPALDKGNAFGSTTDQRGRQRPVDRPDVENASGGDGSDIGAVELQQIPAPSAPDLRAASDTGASDTDDLTADDTPTFDVGDVLPGATVELLRDGATIAEGVASGESIVLTDDTVPDQGTYEYRARQSNGDGTSILGDPLRVVIDVPPKVLASLRANEETVPANTDVTFHVIFSEPVTSVDASDFALTSTGITGARVTGVTGSGDQYLVTANTGTGSGTLRLDVADDDSIEDASGNPLGDVGAGNGDFTTGESYTVEGPNAAPVNAVPGDQSTDEDTPLVFSDANANRISVSDPDAGEEPVRVSLRATEGALTLGGTAGLNFATGDGADDAEVAFTGKISAANAALDGLTYVPATDYNGAADLTITTDDLGNTGTGGARTDTDTVGITVRPVNDAPSFTMGADQTVREDAGPQTVAGWATGISAGEAGSVSFVLTSDDGELFSEQPKLSPDGTLTYTPAKNAHGTATVTVAISGGPADDGAGDAPALPRFQITVQEVNDAPVAANNSYSTAEGRTLRVRPPGVLGNDREVDGDLLSASVTAPPGRGKLKLNRDGSFSYTPKDGFRGKVAFRYRVSDGRGGTATAAVSITVRARPEPGGCTIEGTPGSDVLRGTPGRDVICGLGGGDVIVGGAGDDALFGGAGGDVLVGGAGKDKTRQ